MLTMTDINTIRNLRNNHDKSINHIAKELDVNWRTAKNMQMMICCRNLKHAKDWYDVYRKVGGIVSYGFQKMLSCQIKA